VLSCRLGGENTLHTEWTFVNVRLFVSGRRTVIVFERNYFLRAEIGALQLDYAFSYGFSYGFSCGFSRVIKLLRYRE